MTRLKFKTQCPFCKSKVEFRPVGAEKHIMIVCPKCGSLGKLWKTLYQAKVWFSTRNGKAPAVTNITAMTDEPMKGEKLEKKPGIF